MKSCKAMLPLLLLVPLAGCANPISYQNPNLGHARSVIARSVEAAGGLKRLAHVNYRAKTTVVMSESHGLPSLGGAVSQVRMRIDPRAQTILASAPTGTGWWQASRRQGKCTFLSGDYQPTDPQRQAVRGMLEVVLHRVTGSLNFFLTGEKARNVTRTRVDGIEVYRVGVSGGKEEAKAYYFELETGLLKFVTTGADTPGQVGTITVYQWQTLPGGIAFPQSIRVMAIGQHVLVGLQPLLEVDFSDVHIR